MNLLLPGFIADLLTNLIIYGFLFIGAIGMICIGVMFLSVAYVMLVDTAKEVIKYMSNARRSK